MNSPIQRRTVLQSLLLAPLTFMLPKVVFAAGAAENVSLEDPIAKALQYNEDASKAASRTDKKANCGNCAKYAKCPPAVAGVSAPACVAGKKTDPRAACEILGGKHVAKAGWCMSWVKG